MDINTKLLKEIQPYIFDYDIWPDETEEFLFQIKDFDERQKRAISIVGGIMSMHGKKLLLGQIAELAKIEHGIKELEPWARDHVVHAVLSFILGATINELFLAPDKLRVGNFQWKLAGLFHDIGYPAQFANKLLKRQAKRVIEIRKELGDKSPSIGFNIVPVGFEDLKNGKNSFDLFQKQFNKWGLKIDAKGEFELMKNNGGICHGIMSSLIILNIIDLMYEKYNPKREYKDTHNGDFSNWNQRNFEKEVVPACAAIFVHNLPSRCFKKAKIDRTKAPLAFLLKISDHLQDWERPSKNNPTGFSSEMYSIKIDNGKLVFKIDDDKRREEIRKDIESCIVTKGIEIV